MLEEAWAPEYTYIGIIVDMDSIRKLQVQNFIAPLPGPYLRFLARVDSRRNQMGHRIYQETQDKA